MRQSIKTGYSSMVLAVVAAVGLSAAPQAGHAADATLGADVLSAYVWRGVTFNDEGVIQPSLDVSHESGLGLNVWANFDLGDYDGAVDSGEISETDLTVSYAVPVEGIDLSVGLIEYTFPQAGADTSTREVYVSTGYGLTEDLSVSLDVYYDFDEVDGVYGTAGVAYGIAASEEVALELGASLGAADSSFAEAYGGTDSGLFDWNVSLSGSYALSESVELGAVIAYTDSADTDVLPEQDVDVYGGGSIYWSF
jgi:uncharacterized protein (TIGR02001 family)